MARDIEKFKKEITDYINKFIAGSENTCISGCTLSDAVMNRGHAIPVQIVMPEGYSGNMDRIGPCFYAEELLAEYPDASVAFIAEMINKRTMDIYAEMTAVFRVQAEAEKKTIDDYRPEELVVTAMPSHMMPDNARSGFCVKDIPGAGITMSLKAACVVEENKEHIYFMPVSAKDGRIPTDEEWDRADINTLAQSDIQMAIIPSPVGKYNKHISIAGQINDFRNFYDWFYLASLKQIWEPAIKELNAERIYIIPISPSVAFFVVDNAEVRANSRACSVRNALAKAAMGNKFQDMPVLVLDAATLEIRKAEEGELL